MTQAQNNADMTKEDRRRLVLQFLADHGIAVPPSVIYRNMRLHQGITFGKKSIANYLDEFAEEGLVRRVNPEGLEDRDLRDVPEDKRAWYIITKSGREYLQD